MTPPPLRQSNLSLFESQGFVGERLKQVREANGISMEALAQKVQRSKQAISRYENEIDQPGAEIVAAFAEQFGQPFNFFFEPIRSEQERNTVFFRRMKNVSQVALRRATVWQRWLDDITVFLSEYVELPEFDIPDDLFTPTDPIDIDMAVIDATAIKLREHWRLGKKPIGNLVRTLERKGFIVTRFDVGVDEIDAYSFWSSGEIQTPVIALGVAKDNYFRSRFDTAHELGHMILHRHVSAKDMENLQIYERIEKQAHRFASAFLLPADELIEDIYSYHPKNLLPVKEKWGVSVAAIAHRLFDLEIMSSEDYRKFRTTLARLSMTKLEPLDKAITMEQPVILQQSIRTLVEHAGFTKDDILHDAQRGAATIERLANIPKYFSEPEDLEIKSKNIVLNYSAG